MDEDRFAHCYNSIEFEVDQDDPFSMAEAQRKCLALNFFGSIHLKQDNDLTNYLLEKDLLAYAEIVDDKKQGGVNNYSESILALLPPSQFDNARTWKSGLDQLKLEDFLQPLPCTSNNKLNCPGTEFDEECYRHLQKIINENTETSQVPSGSKDFYEKPFEISQNQNSKSQPDNVKIIQQASDITSEPLQKDEPNNDANKWKAVSFKTAREELHVQNLKKYGNNYSSSENKGTNKPLFLKKSLGTRKGGVFNKFQPPTRSNDSTVCSREPTKQPTSDDVAEEESDERLKNIDPKMIELIRSEIMDCGSKITWDDIAGLELAKNTIQEIVVWPMLRPDIFTGLRRPPKGILLFGPPGTGKTLIGKCIASQSCSTFFSISASSLTSKWIGDGEKMVRALFAVARCHQPAVVFIDEIDSLLSQRSDSEHESSRRLKTEFLVQLDGAGTAEDDRILIIGATNRPQELDEAARRRLVKRLYIPLPDEKAREQIIKNLIAKERHDLTDKEVHEISVLCEGYSGADMKNLCQEASLNPIRSIPPMEIRRISADEVRPLNASDFKSALNRIKSSVSEGDLETYVKWDRQYGCGSDVR